MPVPGWSAWWSPDAKCIGLLPAAYASAKEGSESGSPTRGGYDCCLRIHFIAYCFASEGIMRKGGVPDESITAQHVFPEQRLKCSAEKVREEGAGAMRRLDSGLTKWRPSAFMQAASGLLSWRGDRKEFCAPPSLVEPSASRACTGSLPVPRKAGALLRLRKVSGICGPGSGGGSEETAGLARGL